MLLWLPAVFMLFHSVTTANIWTPKYKAYQYNHYTFLFPSFTSNAKTTDTLKPGTLARLGTNIVPMAQRRYKKQRYKKDYNQFKSDKFITLYRLNIIFSVCGTGGTAIPPYIHIYFIYWSMNKRKLIFYCSVDFLLILWSVPR